MLCVYVQSGRGHILAGSFPPPACYLLPSLVPSICPDSTVRRCMQTADSYGAWSSSVRGCAAYFERQPHRGPYRVGVVVVDAISLLLLPLLFLKDFIT